MSSSSDPAQLFDLSGRVAVVTGGSRGLGRAMVLAFARQGADVVIASRKLEACAALAKEVEAETGRDALPVAYHAAIWQDGDALCDATWERFGRCDVLVNNAGMSPLYDSLEDVSEALWDKVLNVNLRGPFRLSSLVGSRMARAQGGSILNVSSVAAVQPSPNEIPYGAAKAGLQNLTIGLSRALAPKVRVNCIMPGPFLTDISKAWPEALHRQLAKVVPLGRGGQPDEVVGAALYFASEASRFTTGAILKIDGGAVASPA
jgi:NAD(P)-dependent dehydrogenase (short-subunit alcohol dehydrogenase family)